MRDAMIKMSCLYFMRERHVLRVTMGRCVKRQSVYGVREMQKMQAVQRGSRAASHAEGHSLLALCLLHFLSTDALCFEPFDLMMPASRVYSRSSLAFATIYRSRSPVLHLLPLPRTNEMSLPVRAAFMRHAAMKGVRAKAISAIRDAVMRVICAMLPPLSPSQPCHHQPRHFCFFHFFHARLLADVAVITRNTTDVARQKAGAMISASTPQKQAVRAVRADDCRRKAAIAMLICYALFMSVGEAAPASAIYFERVRHLTRCLISILRAAAARDAKYRDARCAPIRAPLSLFLMRRDDVYFSARAPLMICHCRFEFYVQDAVLSLPRTERTDAALHVAYHARLPPFTKRSHDAKRVSRDFACEVYAMRSHDASARVAIIVSHFFFFFDVLFYFFYLRHCYHALAVFFFFFLPYFFRRHRLPPQRHGAVLMHAARR